MDPLSAPIPLLLSFPLPFDASRGVPRLVNPDPLTVFSAFDSARKNKIFALFPRCDSHLIQWAPPFLFRYLAAALF